MNVGEIPNPSKESEPGNVAALQLQQSGLNEKGSVEGKMYQEENERLITTRPDSSRDSSLSGGSTSPEIPPFSSSDEPSTSGQFEHINENHPNAEHRPDLEGQERMTDGQIEPSFNRNDGRPDNEQDQEAEQPQVTDMAESQIFPTDWTPHPRMDQNPAQNQEHSNIDSSVHLPGSPSVQMSEFEFTFAKSLFKDALSSTSATRFQSAVDVCKILAIEYDSDEEEDEKIAPSINDLEQETADLAMQMLMKEAEETFLSAWTEGMLFEELSAYEQTLSGVPFPKTVKRLQRCIQSTRRYFSYVPYLGRYLVASPSAPSVPVSQSVQDSRFRHL